jgi:hypothetical protein
MIALGRKMGGSGLTTATSEIKDKMVHPTFHFNHGEEVKIPKEGHAVIKFRKVRSTQDDSDPDDPHYSHELEIHGIEIKGPSDNDEDDKPIEKLKAGLRKDLVKEKE